MSFLRNGAINRVILHSGVRALAEAAGGIFVLIFLLRAGVSIPAALLAQAAILAVRFVLRPLALPLAIRWGLKPLIVAGTLVIALRYPLLAEVDGVGPVLLALVIVTAIGELFYFLAYHAYFAVIGDTEHRGKQVSVREAVVAVDSIVGPLVGAWALVTVGPGYAFAAVGLVQALAVVPLLGLPNVAVAPSAPGAYRAAWLGGVLYAVDGWFDAFFMTFWQIALFVTLGENIPAYGGAMAIAGLAGAVGGLVLGRSIDAGGGRRMAAIGFGAMGLVVLAQAISLGSPILAVVANALAALAVPLMIPSIGTATYNMAKASPCAMRFSMVAEGGWDVGGVAGCLAAAGLVMLDVSPRAIMLFALPALGLGVVLLRRYFGSLAAVAASDRG